MESEASDHLAGKTNLFDVEFRFLRGNGSYMWIRGRGKILERDSEGKPIRMVGTHADITDRKMAEEALRKSEERFRLAAESASDLIFEWETKTGKLDWYGNLDRHLSRDRHKLPSTVDEWLEMIHPDDRAKLDKSGMSNLTATGPSVKEYRIKGTDGSWLQCTTRSSPVLDDSGKPLRWIGVCIDVTDIKKAEEERLNLERQIQHAQKLESLGVLAGGIAHDFNNLLLGILGNADLALSELSPVSPARESIASIETAAMRAAELTKQMLAYSGKGRFIISEIDLNEIIDEMTHLLDVSKAKNVVIKYNFTDNLPAIKADATQVRQVVMNLLTNASEAIGKKSGVVSISTGAMECDRSYLSETYLDDDLEEGVFAFIEVSDTGCGMDDDTKNRIFDPFFTTKFTGRGLGMAAILGIIRGHKGAIKIYSEPGRGTTVKVLFPALDHPARQEKTEDQDKKWRCEGTILMVDDEDAVLAVGKAMLRKIGMNVLTAEDGVKALELFREHSGEIACVVLDLTMPRMSGEETFRELRRIKSDVKVIMSSGYNEQDVVNRFAGKGLTGFIQKPYRREDLLKVLRKVMEDN
ncbi:MAG: PAS domain-containing protein [Candidatus Krumholzibacteriota bacterium]|nr:PAS domain-containing protein [Candidatus Krumholzibacteriota bacterium]